MTPPGRGSQGTRSSRKPSPLGTCQFIDKYRIKDRKNLNTARCAVNVVQSDIKLYQLKFPSVKTWTHALYSQEVQNQLIWAKKVCQTISDSREA